MAPFHGPNTHQYLIEWTEYYSLLGVDHFYSYDIQENSNTTKLIEYYKRKGIYTVHDWKNAHVFKGWYHHQHAAMNDCLFKHRYSHSWLLYVDIDEFMFPMNQTNFIGMLQDWDIFFDYHDYNMVTIGR
jgi:hypothetical protein